MQKIQIKTQIYVFTTDYLAIHNKRANRATSII